MKFLVTNGVDLVPDEIFQHIGVRRTSDTVLARVRESRPIPRRIGVDVMGPPVWKLSSDCMSPEPPQYSLSARSCPFRLIFGQGESCRDLLDVSCVGTVESRRFNSEVKAP